MFEKFQRKYSKVVNTISYVTIINILLAFTALSKDILLASYLGTTLYADAFMLAFFITNMIGSNFIGNSIWVGSIPIFSRIYLEEDRESLQKSITKLVGIVLIFTIGLGIALYLFRGYVIYILAGGFSKRTAELCMKLMILLLPIIVIYPVEAILRAAIHSYGKFVFTALMPVIFNCIFFMGVAYCYLNNIEKEKGVFIISYTLMIGLVIMLFSVIFYGSNIINIKLMRIKVKKDISEYNENKNVADIIKLTSPYLLIVFFSQGMLYFERSIASNFEIGSISGLNYAYRLSQFPIWVFVSAIATVMFPTFSKLITRREKEKAKKTLLKVVWFIIILTLPLMLAFFILTIPIISVLFLRNSFDNNSLIITGKIFSTYCFVIVGESINAICIKYFLAMKEIKIPLKILFVKFILNGVILIFVSKYIGLYSLGIGAALGSLCSALLFLNKLKIDFVGLFNNYRGKLFKFILSNLGVVLILIFSYDLWSKIHLSISFSIELLFIGGVFLISGIAYLFTVYKFKLI